MQFLLKLLASDSWLRGSLQRGRRALAKGFAVRSGKTAELRETIAPCELSNTCAIGIAIAQRNAHLLQPPPQRISGRAEAKERGATRLQRPLPDANQLAQLRHVKRPVRVPRQHLLQADDHQGMTPMGGTLFDDLGLGQTGDERESEIPFDGARDLGM